MALNNTRSRDDAPLHWLSSALWRHGDQEGRVERARPRWAAASDRLHLGGRAECRINTAAHRSAQQWQQPQDRYSRSQTRQDCWPRHGADAVAETVVLVNLMATHSDGAGVAAAQSTSSPLQHVRHGPTAPHLSVQEHPSGSHSHRQMGMGSLRMPRARHRESIGPEIDYRPISAASAQRPRLACGAGSPACALSSPSSSCSDEGWRGAEPTAAAALLLPGGAARTSGDGTRWTEQRQDGVVVS
eukprot:COSAG01_NODE_3166_length_6474_cov_287.238431_4_plen_244_part_00